MPDIEYVCPTCRQAVSVPRRAAGKTLPCPHCGAPAVIPAIAAEEAPAPRLDFPASEPPVIESARARRAGRRLSAARVVVWGVFLLGLLGVRAVRLAAALADPSAPRESPEQYTAGVAGLFVWFLFCFAIDRMLTPSD